MKDYYAILGIPSSATESEVKRAFRKLAIRYHPDKNPSEDAKARFQEINEAYDTLGNGEKRAAYDARLANPFGPAFEAAPARRHRDPAYRRPGARPPRTRGPSAAFILMRDSLKYVLWVSKIALLFTVLFFIDYFLPYRQVNDYIQQVYAIGSSGPDAYYYVILTGSGEQLKVDNFDQSGFQRGREIRLAETRIFGSVMTIGNLEGTYRAWVSYMYSTHLFLPIMLFVNSLLALIFRKRVEFCFNLNITASILLIINLSIM